MACVKYVEAVFGSGLVADTIMYHLKEDLNRDLSKLLSDVHASFSWVGMTNPGLKYNLMLKSRAVLFAVRDSLPQDVPEDFGFHSLLVTLNCLNESQFVACFTREEDMSFLDKLIWKRVLTLMLERKDTI